MIIKKEYIPIGAIVLVIVGVIVLVIIGVKSCRKKEKTLKELVADSVVQAKKQEELSREKWEKDEENLKRLQRVDSVLVADSIAYADYVKRTSATRLDSVRADRARRIPKSN